MKTIIIANQTGRIDKIIADTSPDKTRSQIKNLIDTGNILVNGKQIKPNFKPKSGDKVLIKDVKPQKIDLEPENIPLDIVFEDDDVIVVNKPQGMVVHPSAGHPNHTLVNALLFHSPLSTINGKLRPGIVHRIDKDTSGLLMVAKNDTTHQFLSRQLKEKKNLRQYIALVHGILKEDAGTVNAPIARSPKDRKKQAVVADGRKAVTHFQVIKRFAKYTLISCRLETGRTHQIRVHMKYIGHPLVGDPLYGPRKTIAGNGQFLHAAQLGFIHPKNHSLMIFSAPIPKIFQETLKQIERQDGVDSLY